jgi:tetraacyldisaccharide 4'-kinase
VTRRRLEAAVRRWWDGEARGFRWTLVSFALFPVEWLFRLVVGVRGWAFQRRLASIVRGPIPVISVGNLSVGGTGKTPVAAWLLGHLTERGLRPALILRGYGRDEVLLHRRWNPEAVVVAGRNRLEAVRRAAEEGAQVAVLDDGFQHRRLHRDLDLVLVGAEEGLPGPLLPRGPFREPARALRRADAVILTEKADSRQGAGVLVERLHAIAPGLPVVRARLLPDGWTDLHGSPASPPEGPVLAACSIARPESFRRILREVGSASVDLAAFPDHHEYDLADVADLGRRLESLRGGASGGTLVVTEKDAVKLAPFADALPETRVLALRVEMEEGEILARLLTALDGLESRT